MHEPAERRVALLELASVHPRDGFNPRSKRDSQKFKQLRASVARRGVLQPLLVTPDPDHGEQYVIVAGESRYLAAVDAGVAEVPCLIDAVDGETGGLDDALVENLLREDLSAFDEARAFRRLREGGLSARAIAQRVGRSAKFVRERIALLELPEELHGRIEAGTVPLSVAPALLALSRIHPDLPMVGVRRVLDGPVRSWDEPTTWDDLSADPVWIVTGSVPEQYEHLPESVYVGGASYPVSGFALEERAAKALDKLAKLLGVQPDSLQVRFDRDTVEQAAALSAAFPSKDGYRTLIVGTDVASQLVGDGLIARLRAERSRAKRERDARRLAATSTGVASPTPEPTATAEPSEDERREQQRRERQEAKEASRRAHTYNVLLGGQLTKHLSRVKLDDRALKILTAAPLASDFREIATRGARIAFPGWPTETTRRNGTVKVTYLETYDAARKANEYLAGASKAGEVAGRSLALLAAARWADEQALPMSRRSLYSLRFARTHGVPWGEEAAELLDELLIERLSPEVTERIRAAKHERDQRRAEEHRHEAERAHAVAELVEQAPTMTIEERRAEISRLQHEYDFGVIDAENRAAMLADPEPGAEVGADDAGVGDRAEEAVSSPDADATEQQPDAVDEPETELDDEHQDESPDDEHQDESPDDEHQDERSDDEPAVEPDEGANAVTETVAAAA
jgi:ParB/RepB/Spo0J family partition protein